MLAEEYDWATADWLDPEAGVHTLTSCKRTVNGRTTATQSQRRRAPTGPYERQDEIKIAATSQPSLTSFASWARRELKQRLGCRANNSPQAEQPRCLGQRKSFRHTWRREAFSIIGHVVPFGEHSCDSTEARKQQATANKEQAWTLQGRRNRFRRGRRQTTQRDQRTESVRRISTTTTVSPGPLHRLFPDVRASRRLKSQCRQRHPL